LLFKKKNRFLLCLKKKMFAVGSQDVIQFNLSKRDSTKPVETPDPVLMLESNSNGKLILCITRNFAFILECNEQMDFSLVGSCRRPSESGVNQVAWNGNSRGFVLCNSHGEAEFYDIDGGNSNPKRDVLRLPLPTWVLSMLPESRSGSLLQLKFRCKVDKTVDGDTLKLCSVITSRMYLLMGTSRGSIIRVLWTGEIVTESESIVCDSEQNVTHLSIGWQSRLGFVSGNGSCGIMMKHHSDESNSSSYCLSTESVLSIALHKYRPLCAVGFANGNILLYNLTNTKGTILKQIPFPEHEISSVIVERNTSSSSFGKVVQLQWSPDSSPFFIASYSDIGSIIWGVSGNKLVSFFNSTVTLWCVSGYRILTAKEPPAGDDITILSTEIVKSTSFQSVVSSGNATMCLQGWNYLLLLRNQEWDANSMSLHRVDLPYDASDFSWPIQSVAVSPSGNHVVVAGISGILLYTIPDKIWIELKEVDSSNLAQLSSLFWLNDDIIGIVYHHKSKYTWETCFISRSSFTNSQVLGIIELPGRPSSIGVLPLERVLSFQIGPLLILYEIVIEISDEGDEPDIVDAPIPSSNDGKHVSSKRLFIMRRASSAIGKDTFEVVERMNFKLMTSIQLDTACPIATCLLPCGATRRAGTSAKFPKCVVLDSCGDLYVVDSDEGATQMVVSRGIFGLLPQSWSKVDESDDVVLDQYLERSLVDDCETVRKLPAVLLYALWIVDGKGLRLWLPALDINGEFLKTKCVTRDRDVVPVGILETHGFVVGITQRCRSLSNNSFCYEIGVRVQPTTHGQMEWLMHAGRYDLASQVIVQASTHLPLFRETLDLFLFSAVENDYKHRHNENGDGLLGSVIKLLRVGKIAAIIDSKTYASLVVTCARKIEATRWELFFKYAGNPEQ